MLKRYFFLKIFERLHSNLRLKKGFIKIIEEFFFFFLNFFSIYLSFVIHFFFSFDLNFLESGVNSSSRQTSGVTKGYPKLAFWLNPHSFFAKDTTTFLNKEKMYLSKRKKERRKSRQRKVKGNNKRNKWNYIHLFYYFKP